MQGQGSVAVSRQRPITGVVRNLQQHSEPGWPVNKTVWSFQLQRTDEETGNPLPAVAVELRGVSFTGTIFEGNEVEVYGKMRRGTIQATRIKVKNGPVVEAKIPWGTVIGSIVSQHR